MEDELISRIENVPYAEVVMTDQDEVAIRLVGDDTLLTMADGQRVRNLDAVDGTAWEDHFTFSSDEE
jgi:hypothetical protein